MKTPKEKWLEELKPSSAGQYKNRFQDFLDWIGTTDEEIYKEWKTTEDRDEFIKKWSSIALRYYRYWVEKTGKVNTARGQVTAVRSFFASQCGKLKIKKGAIGKPKAAKGEHVFSQQDLMKMYNFAGVREKAILATAVSLGWGSSDFLSLEREFLEKQIKRARSEGLNFIRFDWVREKTGEAMMGILTPEAMDSLEEWFKRIPKSKWAFPSNGFGNAEGRAICNDTLNDILKAMVKEADIVTTGSIRFHLLRKFLMGELSGAGLNEFEQKIIVGKAIPVTDLTYLQKIKDDAFEKYCRQGYERIRLVGFTAANHTKLENYGIMINKIVEGLNLLATLIQQLAPPEKQRAVADLGLEELFEELRRLQKETEGS